MPALKLLPSTASDLVTWRLLQALVAWIRRTNFHPPVALLLVAASLYYCATGLSQQLVFHHLWLADIDAEPALAADITRFSLFTLIAGTNLVLYIVLSACATALSALESARPQKHTRRGILVLTFGCSAFLVAVTCLSIVIAPALSNFNVQVPLEMTAALALAVFALSAALFATCRPARLPKWVSLPNLLLAHQVFLLVLAIYYNTQFPIHFADVTL